MKTRLKPRIFPEAGERLHDDRGFEEQMADLGVEIIRRKKEDERVSYNVSVVEERIKALGLEGLLTVKQVFDTTSERLKALIEAGHTNHQIGTRIGVSQVIVSRLRRYHDMVGKPGTKSKSAPVDEANKQALRAAHAAQKMEKAADAEQEEPITYQPVQWVAAPLLDITDAGIVLSPLAAGVSKMLERIGEGQVRLIITVERV